MKEGGAKWISTGPIEYVTTKYKSRKCSYVVVVEARQTGRGVLTMQHSSV